jgi:ACDE family multidrug resistance protein
LVRVFSDTQLIGIGFAVYGFSLALIGAFLGMGAPISPMFIIIPVVVFGIGSGLTIPSVNTAVSGLASEQFRGGVISLRTSFMSIGMTIGPALFAYGAVPLGYQTLLLIAGTLLFVIGSLTVYVPSLSLTTDTPDIVADD